MPAPDGTAAPVQENIRFTVLYGNVYVDLTTGELELGARVYRTPGAADERRVSHPCREGLAHVGVFPVSAVVPDTVRLAAMARGQEVANQSASNEVDQAERDLSDDT